MDIEKHSDIVYIITYVVMGFAWIGKAGGNLTEAFVAGFACLFQGIIMTQLPKLKLNGYIARFTSALVDACIVILLGKFLVYPNSTMNLVMLIMLPIARGSLCVEGVCSIKKNLGKEKVIIAIINSAALAAGVTAALFLTGVAYA